MIFDGKTPAREFTILEMEHNFREPGWRGGEYRLLLSISRDEGD
jgi:hypothetical protein